MFKCHVIVFLISIVIVKETYADFWCKDSALWDLECCLRINWCKVMINDEQFYCIFTCAKIAGDCLRKISHQGNKEISDAREFYNCMENCLHSSSKSECLKSCDKFSAEPYPTLVYNKISQILNPTGLRHP